MDFSSATFIIVVALLFFDGLIFGVAASKGLVSILLLVRGSDNRRIYRPQYSIPEWIA